MRLERSKTQSSIFYTFFAPFFSLIYLSPVSIFAFIMPPIFSSTCPFPPKNLFAMCFATLIPTDCSPSAERMPQPHFTQASDPPPLSEGSRLTKGFPRASLRVKTLLFLAQKKPQVYAFIYLLLLLSPPSPGKRSWNAVRMPRLCAKHPTKHGEVSNSISTTTSPCQRVTNLFCHPKQSIPKQGNQKRSGVSSRP